MKAPLSLIQQSIEISIYNPKTSQNYDISYEVTDPEEDVYSELKI
jgi:hypothetical protein